MTARKFKDRDIVAEKFVWRDITIRVACERPWLGHGDTAHLVIEAISPKKTVIPITETGYRSHFLSIEELDAAGGPVAFVRAWLDMEAKSRRWRELDAASRQFSLF